MTVVDDFERQLVDAGDRWYSPRGRRRRAAMRAARVAVVAVALVAIVAGVRAGAPAHREVPAEATPAFAEVPLVLLQADGWRVDYADQFAADQGNIRFQIGEARSLDPAQVALCPVVPQPEHPCADTPADTSRADLRWGPPFRPDPDAPRLTLPEGARVPELVESAAPVLNTTATVHQLPGGTPGHRAFIATWRADGLQFDFTAGAADADAFLALLSELEVVAPEAWLAALPAGTVRPADQAAAIDAMLDGVPVPAGFAPELIEGLGLVKARYQLGATVTGTVACRWLQQWGEGRRRGDAAAAREAIAAMATAREWPILREMSREGGYPDSIWEYAAAMPAGVYSRHRYPLADAADRGLGCARLGVPLT